MAENDEHTDFVVIFRTGKLWEFDLGRDALKENEVPFFAQTQSLSGVQTALDAAPSMGPGTSWSLLVPRGAVTKAREVLQGCRLDVEKEPAAWDFGPQPQVRKYWKMAIWGMLALIALFFIVEVFLRGQ